ncbi:sec-independent protein translocase protein TatA [Deinococcus sp. HSC-46F16]|uniref:twin-arginine translocase TatA/TatE family subunit n=1 Tax=Deinococcus sp. HSC-46F16 TaxID=2910968 RepID=UPI00209CFBC2|nr:twin-arginine translocase TatA/TatE family subunit [Deinococcus sp. HSC-46F16]MCP2014685.1 sec-independent protein translocase protein TatA [Deinococcus sp. HSC-46F16]
MTFGPVEIFLVVLIAALIFGPKKLPELGKGLGQGLREFRSSTREVKRDLEPPVLSQEEQR